MMMTKSSNEKRRRKFSIIIFRLYDDHGDDDGKIVKTDVRQISAIETEHEPLLSLYCRE